jgi:ABC-2 type transport system permease protein
LEIIARLDPLTYGVDGLRGALIGLGHFSATLDVVVLSAIAAVLVSVGAYLFSRIQL